MSENSTAISKRKFLTTWSILNIVGWFVGTFFIFIDLELEYNYKFSASSTFIGWLPLGASIGLFQWFGLKQFRVNLFMWVLVTAIGLSSFFTLYGWVLNFDSYDYRKYNIPAWLIDFGLAMATLIGGAIIGGAQSIFVRKHISRLSSWIGPYVIVPFSAFSLAMLALGPGESILWYVLLVIGTSITISLFTGNSLLKYRSLNPISRAG